MPMTDCYTCSVYEKRQWIRRISAVRYLRYYSAAYRVIRLAGAYWTVWMN